MELVPIPAVLSAPYAGVQLSEEAARAPGRGLQSAGRSLMEVGDQMQELGQRMQHARNLVAANDARMEMDKAQADIQEFSTREADESKWGPFARDRMKKANDTIGKMKLDPVVNSEISSYALKIVKNTDLAATQNEIRRFKASAVTQSETYAESGDIAKAYRPIDDAVSGGYMHKDEASLKKVELLRIADHADVIRMIMKDPGAAKSALEQETKSGEPKFFPGLTFEQRLVLKNHAEEEEAKAQAENSMDIEERILSGNTENPPSVDEIRQASASNKINARQERTLLMVLKKVGSAQVFDPSQYDAINAMLDNYQVNGVSKGTYYGAISAANLSTAAKSSLVQRLEKVSSPDFEETSHAFKYGSKLLDGMFHSGVLGKYRKDGGIESMDDSAIGAAILSGNMGSSSEVDTKAYMAARARQGQLISGLRNFVATHQGADENDVTQYLAKARKGIIASGSVFMPSIAPTINPDVGNKTEEEPAPAILITE